MISITILRKMTLPAITSLTLLATPVGAQSTLTLNFANDTNSVISFYGTAHSFNFVTSPTGEFQWTVTSESGGSSAIGLMGSFLNGPYNYGAVSTFGPLQQATVTGPLGTITINDGTTSLTGTVDWIDVSTLFQSAGVLNGELDVNVTNIVYSGINPDLQFLSDNQPGTLDLTFQFVPGQNLTSLSSGAGPYSTSYSGSISVTGMSATPEPSTISLGTTGVTLGLFLFKRRHTRA